jgi:hypothetical protein
MTDLLLRRVSPRGGADGPDDYDVMSTHDGLVIGRIIRATTAPEDTPLALDGGVRQELAAKS